MDRLFIFKHVSWHVGEGCFYYLRGRCKLSGERVLSNVQLHCSSHLWGWCLQSLGQTTSGEGGLACSRFIEGLGKEVARDIIFLHGGLSTELLLLSNGGLSGCTDSWKWEVLDLSSTARGNR